ncbi:MAG: hypothetical protein ACLP9L_33670 [Thermoguttaceae bacterium]
MDTTRALALKPAPGVDANSSIGSNLSALLGEIPGNQIEFIPRQEIVVELLGPERNHTGDVARVVFHALLAGTGKV